MEKWSYLPGVYAKRSLAKLAVGWFKSERERERKEGERKGRKKTGGGNPDSKQHQDQLSPMVPWGQVNCLCPGSGDRVVTGNVEGGSAVLP